MTEPPAAPLPPELLERMRTIGLRIDDRGRMWHQADEVTHPGLKRAILRWLDVRADGRAIVRVEAAVLIDERVEVRGIHHGCVHVWLRAHGRPYR